PPCLRPFPSRRSSDLETVCFSGGCTEVETDDHEAAFAAAVLGGLAGIGIGAALAGSREITEAGATVANFGALWGTWFGFAGGYLDRKSTRLNSSHVKN